MSVTLTIRREWVGAANGRFALSSSERRRSEWILPDKMRAAPARVVVARIAGECAWGCRSRTCCEGATMQERDDYADNDLPPPRRMPEGCVYLLIGFGLFALGLSASLVMWLLSRLHFD